MQGVIEVGVEACTTSSWKHKWTAGAKVCTGDTGVHTVGQGTVSGRPWPKYQPEPRELQICEYL